MSNIYSRNFEDIGCASVGILRVGILRPDEDGVEACIWAKM